MMSSEPPPPSVNHDLAANRLKAPPPHKTGFNSENESCELKLRLEGKQGEKQQDKK